MSETLTTNSNEQNQGPTEAPTSEKLDEQLIEDLNVTETAIYQKTNDNEIRDRIFDRNKDYTYILIRRVKRYLNDEAFESLIIDAQQALLYSIDTYDPSKNTKFRTYLYRNVQYKIMKCFTLDTGSFDVPSGQIEKYKQYANILQQQGISVGDYLEKPSAYSDIEISEIDLEDLSYVHHLINAKSLDANLVDPSTGRSLQVYDVTPSPDNTMHNAELKIVLEPLIGALTDTERIIIKRVIFEEFSQADVARELGMSRQTVNSKYSAALRKLKNALVDNNVSFDDFEIN